MSVRPLCKHALHRASLFVPLALLMVALAVTMGVASTGAAPVRSARNAPIAVAAKTMSVHLSSHLRLIGRPGHVNHETGTVSGSFSGTIAVRFVAIGSTGGTATFTIYPSKGGSISGRSVTHGHVAGAIATFSGTASITGGTGSWSHVSGSGLQFHGVLNRQNYHATSAMSGTLHL